MSEVHCGGAVRLVTMGAAPAAIGDRKEEEERTSR